MIIHKFIRQVGDPLQFTEVLPGGAKILSVAIQYNSISVWYEYDDRNPQPSVNRWFRFVLTGKTFDVSLYEWYRFIGTVELDGWVGHLYEYKEVCDV